MRPNARQLLLLSIFLWQFIEFNVGAENAVTSTNKYFDKSIADAEAHLSEEDFRNVQTMQQRQRRQSDQTGGFFFPLQQQGADIFTESGDDDDDFDESAMYNRERFEGDIVNPKLNGAAGEEETNGSSSYVGPVMRNAVRQSYLKWPNGRIPYTISAQYTAFGRARIAAAIQEFHDKSCVQFVPKVDSDLDYVHISPEDGCYSMVGKTGGKQPVSIGSGCIQKGVIQHELLHSTGFFHEQSRADRDQFIKIIWTNVETGLEDQFDKYSLAMIDHLGTKYDYGSIMHYGPTAFSKNGRSTIEPLQRGVKIGQRVGFSETDLFKLNKLYNCPDKANGAPPTQGTLPISVTRLPDGSIQNSVNPNCVDLRDDCVFLAQRGHCVSSFGRSFMSINCPMTCGQCVPTANSLPITPACADEREWCDRFAAHGMCNWLLFHDYMRTRCPRSCGVC